MSSQAPPFVKKCEDFTIRLWPDTGRNDDGVDFNGFLFNRQSKKRYRACRNALVVEARDLVD